MTTTPNASRWVAGGVAGTVVLVGLSAVLAWWEPRLPATAPGEVRSYFDVFGEGNLPSWWAASVLLLGALACGAVAALSGRGGQRLRWGVFAVLVLLLSIDEATALHERLDRFVLPYLSPEGFPYLWVIPGAVLGFGVVLCAVWVTWTAPQPSRGWLVAGLLLLLGSAMGGEVVQGWLVTQNRVDWPFVLTYHLEEAGETLGALALVAGAANMLSIRRVPTGVIVGVRSRSVATP